MHGDKPKESFKLRRPGTYLHTGKRDWDDHFKVGRNPTRRRTMRVFKRRARARTDQFLNSINNE